MSLRCRVGFHAWHIHPNVRPFGSYLLCARCGISNMGVRWFPDRFRWLSYPMLTERQYAEIVKENGVRPPSENKA